MSHRLNEKLQGLIPQEKNYVVYNDTDSGYLSIAPFVEQAFKDKPDAGIQEKVDYADNFVKQVLDPVIEDINTEFSDALNAFDPSTIKTEREAIADCGVFLSKKRYFLRVYDDEGNRYHDPDPYMKRMGIDIVRSSTPKFVKDKLEESINIILDGDRQHLSDWLDKVKAEYTQQPLEDVAKSTSIGNLNYNIHEKEFKDGKKVTVPVNSRAAIASNEYVSDQGLESQYPMINVGDKVKLLYMRLPNPTGQNVLAFVDPRLAEGLREYVDYDTNWEKYFMSPLNIMIEPLGWNLDINTEEMDEW